MEQNNENILSEETIGFIKKCYIHLNQARQGVWAFADLAEIVWNPKIQKKNKELYFSIIHDAIAYEIIKYEEILEMSELKNDFLAFYSKFVSKINTSHEYTNFLEDRITTLENRFGLVWKEQEEQLLKIVSEDEIILGVGKFLINKDYIFDGESKDKKKKFIKNKDGKQFTLTRKRGDSFLYFCKELNQLFLLYSVQSKINVYSFVENHYTKYYPILVKKGDNFGFGEARDNLLIEGDNYFALQLLQFTHRGKIDVIYIDPPYNTGKGDFKYNDSYVGEDDSGRHSKWLSFMDKRLKLAKNLLSETGIIFISIDNHEQANLKKLLDSIWGENNFIENYIWESTFRPDNSSKLFRQNAEHVVCYGKSKKSIKQLIGSKEGSTGLPSLTKKSMKENVLEFFGNEVKTTLPNGVYKSGSFNSGYELLNDVEVKDGLIITPFKLKGRVIWSQEYLREQLLNGTEIIIKSEGFVPYSKKTTDTILAPNTLIPADKVGDVLVGRSEVTKIFGEAVFNYPKPTSLVKYLVNFCEKQDIIVLDFFAGSGTTGHAITALNEEDGGSRKYILCTNNEGNICEDITYQRLFRVHQSKNLLTNGLEYLQIKHISDLDLESADDIGNFEYVKHVNNVKFSATKTIEENEYIYITDTYSVFKKTNKNKQKEYCDFFEQSIKENITNLVFVSSDRIEYDYFRKVISDYISTLEENPLFEKIKYYQMSKNYMDNMLSVINGEEEIDVEKYMVDEENQENGEQQ